MKNVAKCDTWCELQNPVNHRVFERKLRPKPLGRGHVCLGVMHRRPPHPSEPTWLPVVLGGNWLPVCSRPRLAQKASPRRQRAPRRSVVTLLSMPRSPSRAPVVQATLVPRPYSVARAMLASRPQVRRDYPLSLSISISGGKETYQDSLSNGERTGKSPA